MVALIPKSEIEALNIDTVERAIVFAALALRAAIVGADNSNNKSRDVGLNVSINRDNTSDLDIDALLSFDAYKFYTEGGNLIDNVIEFSAITPDLSNQLNYSVASSIPSIPNIPDYDENSIDTFEKYLLYYAFILLASIEDKNHKIVTLSFLKSSPESAKLKLNVSIPIDLDKWLLGFYLDLNAGSDSNDGLTAGTPFLTLGKLIETLNSKHIPEALSINVIGTITETIDFSRLSTLVSAKGKNNRASITFTTNQANNFIINHVTAQ